MSKVYQYLEPGPVVLLTTFFKGRVNVMTLSWNMMVEFEPPLVACVVSSNDFSFAALRASRECVIVVAAPLIAECFANLECKVVDSRLVNKYNLFILNMVRDWQEPAQQNSKTIHHQGYGRFAVDGETIVLHSRMRKFA